MRPSLTLSRDRSFTHRLGTCSSTRSNRGDKNNAFEHQHFYVLRHNDL